MSQNEKAFSLVEIIIVMAIIGILAAITVVAFKPREILANGRNAKRLGDVRALNLSIGQWLAREGADDQAAYDTLGLKGETTQAITPKDGSVAGEGVDATAVSELALPAYLQIIPKDPDGVTEYRVGVDDMVSPRHILVCTDQMEITDTYPESLYPAGIFCLAN
jgi:prepilin-type N-terminal cleavage/methylation domain-containing protein